MRTRRVVWLSTSLETRGGVASFVRGVQGTSLWDEWDVRHVATHRDGSVASRIFAFMVGGTEFLWGLMIHRPGLVHLHMASYGSFVRKSILAWIARAFGVPVIIHVHGGGFRDFVRATPRVFRSYIRATLSHADVVIALGESWARRLEEIAPHARVVVVPNGVTPHCPVAQPERTARVRVLFMGDISVEKGVFVLLDAWAQMSRELGTSAQTELVLAGDGLLERAECQIDDLGLRDQVRLLGWVAPAEVEGLLQGSQVLTLPSFQEGQPMAVLEAMARGLCVVASDVGGVPDLIDAESGVLVPPGDVEALAAALGRVVTNEGDRVRLGAQALQRVRDRFDVEQTGRALDALYRELIP